MNQVKHINILEVAKGALAEQIDIELRKIMENLQDPNTDYKPVRELTIKVKLKNLDERRTVVGMTAQAKATTAPNTPIGVMLFSETTQNGVVVAEANKHDPNQVSFDEEAGQAVTNVLNMAERKTASGKQ